MKRFAICTFPLFLQDTQLTLHRSTPPFRPWVGIWPSYGKVYSKNFPTDPCFAYPKNPQPIQFMVRNSWIIWGWFRGCLGYAVPGVCWDSLRFTSWGSFSSMLHKLTITHWRKATGDLRLDRKHPSWFLPAKNWRAPPKVVTSWIDLKHQTLRSLVPNFFIFRSNPLRTYSIFFLGSSYSLFFSKAHPLLDRSTGVFYLKNGALA